MIALLAYNTSTFIKNIYYKYIMGKLSGKKTKKAYKATPNSRGSRGSPIQGSPFNNPLQYQELPLQSFYHTQIPPLRRDQPTYQPTYLPTVYVNPNPYMHPNVQYIQQPQPQPQPQRFVIRNLNDLLNVSYTQEQLDALTGPPSPEPDRNDLYRKFNYTRGGRSKKYSRKNRRK